MRHLKYLHLFYGAATPFYLAVLLCLTVPPLFAFVTGLDLFDAGVWLYGAPATALGVLLYCALHIRRLSDKEHDRIRRAQAPQWRKASEFDQTVITEHISELRTGIRGSAVAAVLMALTALFTGMISDVMNWRLFWGLFIMLSGIPLIFLCGYLHQLLVWRRAEGSTEVCDLPVASTFTRMRHGFPEDRTLYFFVFYLKSGKYVLQCRESCKHPHAVRLLRCRNCYIYVPY